MSIYSDAVDTIEREAIRLQSLQSAAAVLRGIDSIEQAASESTKRRNATEAEHDALVDKVIALRTEIEDATGKAADIVRAGLEHANQKAAEIIATAKEDAAKIAANTLAIAQSQAQTATDAANQSVAAAQAAIDALAVKNKKLAATVALREAEIEALDQRKTAIESALADLKTQFAS